MKIWEKTKKFCKDHKIAVVSAFVGTATFVTGWIARKKFDYMTIDKTMELLPDEIDKEFKNRYGENASLSLVTDESMRRLEEEQERARAEYPEKFAIMDEVIEKLNLDTDDNEMWMIENGIPFMFKDSWYQNGEKES